MFVVLAEFTNKNFYNDAFVKRGRELVELNMRDLRSKKAENATSAAPMAAAQPLPVGEEGEASAQPLPLDEEGEVVRQDEQPNATVTERKSLFNFVSIAAAVILGAVIAALVLSIPSFVENANAGIRLIKSLIK